MLPLMLTQMDALRATIEMNRNGMRVDWKYVDTQRVLYSEWLLDLFTSPVVYAYDGTLVAVNIDATTYEVKKHIQDNAFFIELNIVKYMFVVFVCVCCHI